MFKIIGSFLIAAAFIVIGYLKCSAMSRRHAELFRLRQAMMSLRGEISLKMTPLGKAFDTAGKQHNCKCFILCSSYMKNLGAEGSFKRAVLETAEVNNFTKSDTDAILSLASGLGKCDMDNQLKQLDYTVSLLDNAITMSNREKTEKSKMIMHGSVFAGVAIILMLI